VQREPRRAGLEFDPVFTLFGHLEPEHVVIERRASLEHLRIHDGV